MSISSDSKVERASECALADEHLDELADAHELLDHEFTLDPDDDVYTAPNAAKRPTSQPPPPPRRKGTRVYDVVVAPHAARGRSASGVFALVTAPESGLATAQAELTRLQTQLRARDAYLRELEHALAANTRQLAAAGLESAEDVARLLGRLRGQAFRIAELESELRQASATDGEPRLRAKSSEELQRIRGIGRRFAELLIELGYDSLGRIAACSEQELALIAKRLRVTRERIARERWIEQARALARDPGPQPSPETLAD